MNSGNTFPSSTTAGDVNPPPILQPSSSFYNPTSFSQPLNPNNPNLNSIYNLDYSNSNYDQYLDPNLVDNDDPNPNFGPEKLGVSVTNKNPKKRTRASRRAPTTVLTTDTTNFRQMVQEFTGIPAAPFSSSSAYSSRLDLYAGSVAGLAKQVNNCQPYPVASMQPVRPSAQKMIQIQPPPSYLQITPSETSSFTKQPLNISNSQNQMFPFQSISQTNVAQQVNALEASSGFTSSSSTNLKRWRGQDENMMNFEGLNGNYENVIVSSDDGEQHQQPSNEDSWSF